MNTVLIPGPTPAERAAIDEVEWLWLKHTDDMTHDDLQAVPEYRAAVASHAGWEHRTCPAWCTRGHSRGRYFSGGVAVFHSAILGDVAVGPGGDHATVAVCLDYDEVQYPEEPARAPYVELGGSDNLPGLTAREARELAALLDRAAGFVNDLTATP